MPDSPTTIDEIKKTPKMMAAYLAYAKQRFTLNEVMFYFDKGNAQALYPKYIDPAGSAPVNVSGNVTRPAGLLADNDDWDNKGWDKILKDAKVEVAKSLNDDVRLGFCGSKEYKEYLAKTTKTGKEEEDEDEDKAAKKKLGNPDKAAKVLGIKDTKTLGALMKMLGSGNRKKAKELYEDLAEKEKKLAKLEAIENALKKAGLI